MDDNVMKRYSTKPTEASHHIQYDQGKGCCFLELPVLELSLTDLLYDSSVPPLYK